MNNEMKKLIGKFLLSSVLISCFTAFAAGSTTVSQRGEYNIYLTKYAVMSFSASSEKLEATVNENRLTVNIPTKKLEAEWEKYVCFTPLSLPYYLFQSVKRLL